MRQRLLLFLLFCPLWVFAAKDSTAIFQGYSGGMMVHAGYLFGDNPAAVLPSGESLSSQGITGGIGGSLRINLKRHLRVGCEGFVSTMNSQLTSQRNCLKSGSYVRTGWGGVLADACWRGYSLFKSKSGDSIAVYTRDYARFAESAIPLGEVSLSGIVEWAKYNGGSECYQLKMRYAEDCIEY